MLQMKRTHRPMDRRGHASLPRGLLIMCIAVAALVLLPDLVTVIEVISGDWRQATAALQGSDVLKLALNAAAVATVVVPACGVIGVATAWFVERTTLPGRRIWALLLVAPVTIPLFVTSYAWAGFGPAWQGFLGAICVTAFSYYPVVYLIASAALRGMDPALEESARALGDSTWSIFRRIILPQLRPAIIGALLIVTLAMLVQDDAFVALHYPVFVNTATAVYKVSLSAGGAAFVSLGTVIPCIILLIIEARWRGNARYTRTGFGSRGRAIRYELGVSTAPVVILFAALILISLGIPVGTLIHWFAERTPEALASAPAGSRNLIPAAFSSVLICGAAAVVGTLLALPSAVLVTRYRGPVAVVLERIAYLPFALPDFMGAVAIGAAAVIVVPALYGNVALLILNSAILFIPLALVALKITFEQVDPRLDEASRSLGHGDLGSFLNIDLPLARPGMGAAAVLVFTFTLGALSSTQLLLPPGMSSLTTSFEQDAYSESFAAAAPYAAVMMGLAFIATYVLMSRFGKIRTLRSA